MDLIIIMYLILGATMLMGFGAIILIIAGRDMFFAFYRWVVRKGCDVFLVDPSNNHVYQYYKVAKDNIFKIDDKIYLTNPYKLKALNPQMVAEVQQKLNASVALTRQRIEKFTTNRDLLFKQAQSLANTPENTLALQQLTAQIKTIDGILETLKSKLDAKTSGYYRLRRPVYFYIKDDPIPKDFHELYSEMDSIQLANVISRAQTKDPKGIQQLEKDVALIKKLVFVIIVGLVIIAWFSFHADSGVKELAQNMGVKLSI